MLGLLALAGLLALVASAQPWWRARAEGSQITFNGGEVSGGLSQALAVVLLAGTVLSLTLRVRGRRILGVLLAVTGAGMLIVGVLRQQPTTDAVQTKIRQVSLADQFDLAATAWPWVFAAAGLVALVAAGSMVWAAPSWPGRRSRFQRSAVGSGQTPASTGGAEADPSEDPAAAWQALDAGLDPTAAEPESVVEHDAPDHDPDVHEGGPGVTMERKPGTQPPR